MPSPGPLEILNGAEWDCRQCGSTHKGMFDLAAYAPDPWPGAEEYRPNSEITLEGDFLSEDFCVMDGRYFFVRCVLEIPVNGLSKKFGFGCWSTLSRENFEKYIEGFDSGDYGDAGPWSSWLCNRLLPFMEGETQPPGCTMFPQLDRQRPTLRVETGCDALTLAQSEGITAGEALAIYDAYGHFPAS